LFATFADVTAFVLTFTSVTASFRSCLAPTLFFGSVIAA
jgi:hypothetical protein